MTIDLEEQHDENQQTAIWRGEVSNEGHVYAALGIDPPSLAFEEPTCVLDGDYEVGFAFKIRSSEILALSG
jgi:hypothetical protein